MRSIRLLPMVILTAIMLFGLKSFALLNGDWSGLSGIEPASAQGQPAQPAAPAEGAGESNTDGAESDTIDAGSAHEPAGDATSLPVETSRDTLLERLGERRLLMDSREQDMLVREQLLQAAERRLEERMVELAALEQRVSEAVAADEERENEEIARLVQVYAAMRAKDAAAIFDLLELPILVEVATAMNPRTMADIMGNMQPETARRLTIALAGTPRQSAGLSGGMGGGSGGDLPRIEGVPVQ